MAMTTKINSKVLKYLRNRKNQPLFRIVFRYQTHRFDMCMTLATNPESHVNIKIAQLYGHQLKRKTAVGPSHLYRRYIDEPICIGPN